MTLVRENDNLVDNNSVIKNKQNEMSEYVFARKTKLVNYVTHLYRG